jgi:sortase (surface protein transpeptidase)
MTRRAAFAALPVAVLLLSGCTGGPGGTGMPPSSPPSAAAPTAGSSASPSAAEETAATPTAVPVVPRRDSSPQAQAGSPEVPPPARLEVPDVGLDMPVLPMGVDDSGAMALPADTADAGWYRFGPAPREAGTTVIAAHVDSRIHGLGAFARLRDVPENAAVTVTTADGTRRTYRVERIERTPKTEVPLELLFDRGGPERLVLVTCGGRFDRGTGHYVDNVLVTALPEP